MQGIQDAVSHFGQGARLLEESVGQVVQYMTQINRAQLAQQLAEERLREMEERLGTEMEQRWRQLERRMESMVLERVEDLVAHGLRDMVTQCVEAKVKERLDRIEQKLLERNGDRETGETSPNAVECERVANGGYGKTMNFRLTALETSVQKALKVMFPRVEALLSQIEEQSLMTHKDMSPEHRGSSVPKSGSSTVSHSSHPMVQKPKVTVCNARYLRATHVAPLDELVLICSTPQTLRPPVVADLIDPGHCDVADTTTSEDSDADTSATHIGFCGETLIVAAKGGRTKEVETHLNAGVCVDACDSYGNTALYWTAFKGHASSLRLLIDRDADVNCRNHEGWTPLHAAARSGYTPCIALLLDAGAAIEGRTEVGRTPLHLAAHFGRTEAVDTLLTEGAIINAKDNDGRIPLDFASSSAVRRLLRY